MLIMEILNVLLVCVLVKMVSTNNESVVYNGVNHYRYQIGQSCSLIVPTSDVEQYHRAKAKATKLLYVDFEYSGIQWTVINIPEEKSKYIIMLGKYELFTILSLFTLSFGIEHTNVTFKTLPQHCATKPEVVVSWSRKLVANRFERKCKDHCLENSELTCIEGIFFPALNLRSDGMCENLFETHDVIFLNVLIYLGIFVIFAILYILSEKIVFNIVCPWIGERYHYIPTVNQSSGSNIITIIEKDTNLIEKQHVPSGIITTFVNIFESSCLPEKRLDIKRNCCDTQFKIRINTVFSLQFILISVILNYLIPSFLFVIFLPSSLFVIINLVVKFCQCCYRICLVSKHFSRSTNVYFCHRFLPLYATLKPISKRSHRSCCCISCSVFMLKCFSDLAIEYTRVICCLLIALLSGFFFTFTLIGIITNSVVYLPLVLASIVYWLKVSNRLSNWYTKFFDTILNEVQSIAKDCSEVIQMSGTNRLHIVQPRPLIQTDVRVLKAIGIPILIDRKGHPHFTRFFFYRCIRYSLLYFQNNPTRLVLKGILHWFLVNVFLVVVGLVINQFGVAGENLMPHISLVSLASGIFPFLVDYTFVKELPFNDELSDISLKSYIKDLMNEYEESFAIVSQSDPNELTQYITDEGQQITGRFDLVMGFEMITTSNLPSGGLESNIVQSNQSSEENEHTALQSNVPSHEPEPSTEPSESTQTPEQTSSFVVNMQEDNQEMDTKF